MEAYSLAIWEKLIKHLEGENIHNIFTNNQEGQISFPMHVSAKIHFTDYVIRVGDDNFTVMSIFPMAVDTSDAEATAKMNEFISRANWGLKNGNFEFDFGDGEIRYKCYVDCDNQLPSDDVIRNSILCPAAMYRRYGQGILNVMFHNADPKEAVKACEGKDVLSELLAEIPSALRERFLERMAALHNPPDEEEDHSEEESLSYEAFLEMVGEGDTEEFVEVTDEEDAD